MLFKPNNFIEADFEGLLKTYHSKRELDLSRPFGNIAEADLADCILGLLLGLNGVVRPILEKAINWLNLACEKNEIFGLDPNQHWTVIHWAKAIGQWVKDSEGNENIWFKVQKFEEARWHFTGRPWPKSEIVKHGLDDFMAFSFQSGESNNGFSLGADIYERYQPQNKLPSIKKILKPREYAYALCLNRLGRADFDEDELFDAGRKMLQANLETRWVGAGQYIRAATWLKIMYWHRDKSKSPLDCLLCAYENMPNVKRPTFV
jgi:hypothetical protein